MYISKKLLNEIKNFYKDKPNTENKCWCIGYMKPFVSRKGSVDNSIYTINEIKYFDNGIACFDALWEENTYRYPIFTAKGDSPEELAKEITYYKNNFLDRAWVINNGH